MRKKFEDVDNCIMSTLIKPSVSLYSSELVSEISTLGECDVKLKFKDFECISTVIVAKNLAYECLLGMNVLTKWPAMREAIKIMAKVSGNNQIKYFETQPKITR